MSHLFSIGQILNFDLKSSNNENTYIYKFVFDWTMKENKNSSNLINMLYCIIEHVSIS